MGVCGHHSSSTYFPISFEWPAAQVSACRAFGRQIIRPADHLATPLFKSIPCSRAFKATLPCSRAFGLLSCHCFMPLKGIICLKIPPADPLFAFSTASRSPVRICRGISGGERRRVSTGVEAIHDTAVLLLDEPTSGLDFAAAVQVVSMLRNMAELHGRTIILSIHQPRFRILQQSHSFLLLGNGRVIHHGSLSLLGALLSFIMVDQSRSEEEDGSEKRQDAQASASRRGQESEDARAYIACIDLQ